MKHNDWDDDAYVRIVDARYDPERDDLTVRFADEESVSLAAMGYILDDLLPVQEDTPSAAGGMPERAGR